MNAWLREVGIPSILVELSTPRGTEIERNLAGLQAVLRARRLRASAEGDRCASLPPPASADSGCAARAAAELRVRWPSLGRAAGTVGCRADGMAWAARATSRGTLRGAPSRRASLRRERAGARRPSRLRGQGAVRSWTPRLGCRAGRRWLWTTGAMRISRPPARGALATVDARGDRTWCQSASRYWATRCTSRSTKSRSAAIRRGCADCAISRPTRDVAVVADVYDDGDWSRLGFVLVAGWRASSRTGRSTTRAVAALRDKYAQYRAMASKSDRVIAADIEAVDPWGRLRAGSADGAAWRSCLWPRRSVSRREPDSARGELDPTVERRRRRVAALGARARHYDQDRVAGVRRHHPRRCGTRRGLLYLLSGSPTRSWAIQTAALDTAAV